MKTIFYLSILFVTVTMMSSCENELPFNINNNPPKLVMNALINAESTDNLLFLNFTSKENSTHVQNVTVEVRINGELKESLRPLPPETEGNPQCRFGITSRFTPGDAVRIDAITDDGQYHAWTEINVPQRPFEIENVDTVTVPLAQSGYTTEYLRYRITINDRPNETNYYRIVIDKQTTLWGYNHEEGGGDDYIYWTKHSYNFIGREDVVLTDGQPTTGDDEDNGLFDTAKNIYGVFDDTRFRNTSYIDLDIVNQSLQRYPDNKLFQFLSAQFGEAETLKLMAKYKVGTSKHWDGATVFWQIDYQNRVRTGKIMLYNPTTGKRIKEPYNHVTWVHSVLHKEDYNLKQCFFGEHLLPEDKSRPVALVESEKTAIIASYYLPQFLWIASGGKNGCFNVNSLSVLAGRSVVLFPDLGATNYWQSKISLMKSCGIEVQMFDYLEVNATEDERKEGYDIADYLLKVKPDEAILQQMIRKNPVLKTLIDTFDLKLISVQQGTPQPKVSPPKKRGFRL